jgi:hypothetical protein
MTHQGFEGCEGNLAHEGRRRVPCLGFGGHVTKNVAVRTEEHIPEGTLLSVYQLPALWRRWCRSPIWHGSRGPDASTYIAV